MTDKARALQTVLVDCLGIASHESVLVVTDPRRASLAAELVSAARELASEAVLAEMTERISSGTEPPDPIAAAMLEADVLILATSHSLSHTEARHQATQKGARTASMPSITEEMLVRTMNADYGGVKRRSDALARLVSAASTVHITSDEGTDVTFSVEGRQGQSDSGDLRAPGAFGNLPAGEGFVAPVEGATRGTIVFDGTMLGVGRLDDPLIATIEDGYATFSGFGAEQITGLLDRFGRDAFAVAELGIGTNETAMLTGNILEDEKILGTIHVAFGDNHSFGGTVRVASHHDGLVMRPTVAIDGQIVLKDGSLLV